MSFDDIKEHDGRKYSGMAVGTGHSWLYPDGRWKETKVSPDEWKFTFEASKKRTKSAPAGSGVPLDSRYHWYILASQRVRKVDADTYETFMEGRKFKVGHKRPNWRQFSYEYPEQRSEKDRIMDILVTTLEKVKESAHVEF